MQLVSISDATYSETTGDKKYTFFLSSVFPNFRVSLTFLTSNVTSLKFSLAENVAVFAENRLRERKVKKERERETCACARGALFARVFFNTQI